MPFQEIIIITKTGSREAANLALEIQISLIAQRYAVRIYEAKENFLLPEKKTGFVIVLGGDGTMLGIGRKLAGTKIPLFGINFGRVGYLCATGYENWKQPLFNALQMTSDKFPRFLVLKWILYRRNKKIFAGVAVNDIVISRDKLARLVCTDFKIDGKTQGKIRGDGIICCTSLGSTGYNISAGGPLIAPALQVLCVTPVCPFLSHSYSQVFPGSATLELVVEPSSADCYLTIDGQEGQRLESGDKIIIRGWRNALSLAFGGQYFN